MFDLKHFMLRFGFLLLLVIMCSAEVTAQYFDTLIFRTSGLYWKESVIYMGDQNGDGCDDFMITMMDTTAPGSEGKAWFYYGGNPVPDTPVFYFRTINPLNITACDLNRDGYRDVISRNGTNLTYPISFLVYLGGPNLDTVPDYEILHPENSKPYLYGRDWPIDFDGDGWEEWVTFSTTGKFFFIISSPGLQPFEYHVLIPDSAYSNYQFRYNYLSFADVDGDGKTDFSPFLQRTNPSNDLRRFYFGNNDFLFTDYYQFSSDTTFQPQNIFMVNDMNGNGNGELIVFRGTAGGDMPYALSFGSNPPNITPEVKISAGGLSGGGVSTGDINGDGYGDLLKYLPYDSYALYLGGSTITGLIAKLYVSNVFLRDINFAGRVGDINGDGIDDICVGENAATNHQSIPAGALYIYKGTRTPASVEDEVVEGTGEKNIEVAISPNPTNGKVNIHFTLPDSGMLSSEIFDILGQRIYNNSTQEEKGSHTKELNIQNYAVTSGIYIFHFTLKTGEKTLTKSVKVQLIK
ncbi:MAG: T9SS type A sorting domain-containing protein [Ignavibacteriaceae bacterium]|nr:T9SS type A sorting domain-containing protein [Ignavibacteriaceae bacterium]